MRSPISLRSLWKLLLFGCCAIYILILVAMLNMVYLRLVADQPIVEGGKEDTRRPAVESYPGDVRAYPGRFLLHSASPLTVPWPSTVSVGQATYPDHSLALLPTSGSGINTTKAPGRESAISKAYNINDQHHFVNSTKMFASDPTNLVNRTRPVFSMHRHPRNTTAKQKPFSPVMTAVQRRHLLDTAKNFALICHRINISYFLYGGSLLGSYRHHDIIPWDDDIDVFVDIDNQDELYSALRLLSPMYDIYMAGPRLKMWSRHANRTSRYPWSWPYLDISFFQQNTTHIWDTAKDFNDYIYPKSIVFPLHKRPLGDYFFSAPKDSYANLKLTYRTDGCTTSAYSHKFERVVDGKPRVTTSCDRLKDHVPFVHRTPHPKGVLETLKLGNATLRTIVVEEPSDIITEPYKLVRIKREV